MLEIKYLNKKKNVPSDWSEINIEQFHGLYQVMYKFQDIDLEEDETNQMLFIREFASYILKENMNVIDQMNPNDITRLVNATQNLLSEYEPQKMRYFDFKDERYFFPTNDMRDTTFGEFIETSSLTKSAKLLKNGQFDVIAEQMARLCKKADEVNEYLSEEIVLERAEEFKKLPMDIVWEFSFFLLNQQGVLTKIFQTYGEERQVQLNQKEQEKFLNLMDGLTPFIK